MTEIETTINEAIEGGYNPGVEGSGSYTAKYHSDMLLDPKFWQAVGKVRGWEENVISQWGRNGYFSIDEKWRHYQLTFIDYLADGLTIEAALTKLK